MMADKEQIMINDVDVSECVSFDKLNGQNICCYEDTREDKIPFANFCVENKNCYFKQLARKTQECEELKKQLKTSEKWRIKAESSNEKLDLKNTCYRKALEEIDKVINNIFDRCLGHKTDGCTPVHNVCGDLIKILDIINKAKGNNND